MGDRIICGFSLEHRTMAWAEFHRPRPAKSLSQFGTNILHHPNGAQNLLGKGDEQPSKQKALGPLAGIVALDRHPHLHHAPAQDDDAYSPDAGEDEVRQIELRWIFNTSCSALF